ncbi:hypothetical protein GFS60_08084 (plasmid) [Rhodococcus sp. WAY2]|nr:hypothetical protein GFS60_08084 [Rhodococcus sp. WAY2]
MITDLVAVDATDLVPVLGPLRDGHGEALVRHVIGVPTVRCSVTPR